ncbi:MAG: homoserine dehydrogenase [Pseudomonadota bacterium]
MTLRPPVPNVPLVGLAADLAEREATGKPIRVGVIGAGQMGTDLVVQAAHMHGLEVAAVGSRTMSRISDAIEIAGYDADHGREANTASAMTAAMEAGKLAMTEDNDLVISNPLIDVVIDATGVPECAATTGWAALQNCKHLVMMNVEADITIGALLKAEADRRGVVYSVGAGDEPSSVMELIEFVTAMGHDVVAAGKGKNNPLNIDAVPDDYREEATRRNMNPRMLVEFVDGSKTMVELACIANATGLVPDIAGMHGPEGGADDLAKLLIPREEGGLLSQKGVVDYCVKGGLDPGVFVVAEMKHPRIQERCADLKVTGNGKYFTFVRPYHLTSLEVPLTCARVVLTGRPDMVPLATPTAEVCAVAKKNMAPGESLDFIGETCYRSWTMRADEARAFGALPVGLLHHAKVIAPIAKGDLITRAHVQIDATSDLARLRAQQDAMVAANLPEAAE